MAKATIEYDLNDFDDEMAFKRANKATDMAMVIWELVFNARKKIMNEIEFKNVEDPYVAAGLVFDFIHEELNENNINIEDLIN